MRLVFLAHVEQELTFYLTLCRSLFILWKVPVDWWGKSDGVRYCPNQTREYHATSITCFLWGTEGIVVFAHDVNGTAGLPIQTYILTTNSKPHSWNKPGLLFSLKFSICIFLFVSYSSVCPDIQVVAVAEFRIGETAKKELNYFEHISVNKRTTWKSYRSSLSIQYT